MQKLVNHPARRETKGHEQSTLGQVSQRPRSSDGCCPELCSKWFPSTGQQMYYGPETMWGSNTQVVEPWWH